MSGALPTTRAPSGLVPTSWAPVLISRAHSLKTQRRKVAGGAHRWLFRMPYESMEKDVAFDLWAFLSIQHGQYEQFTLTLPTGIWPRGAWTGTPLAAGAAVAGASSVAIDGLSAGVTGIGKRGDFVKFAGHTKVYIAAADFNSNGSGQATLTVFPPLVAAVADNEALTVSAVPFTVIKADDKSDLNLSPPVLSTLEFAAIEDY